MRSFIGLLAVLFFVTGEGWASNQDLKSLEDDGEGPVILDKYKDANGKAVVYLDPNKGVIYLSDGNRSVANCVTSISFVDGENAELFYRDRKLSELLKKHTYPQVVNLLVHDIAPEETPTNFLSCLKLPQEMLGVISHFPKAMDRISFMQSSLLLLEAVLPGESLIPTTLGLMPTLFAYSHRHALGEDYIAPKDTLSYEENVLYMMNGESYLNHTHRNILTDALRVMLIIHAEHGTNASTSMMRNMKSAGTSFVGSLVGALGTLNGDKHGKANQKTPRMYREKVESRDNVSHFLGLVSDKKEILFGFGHRVYKGRDPRLAALEENCPALLKVSGVDKDPLVTVANETISQALIHPYFTKRGIFPNIDSKSWMYMKALGLPENMYTAFFGLARTAGYTAHFIEHNGAIFRPASVQGPDTKKKSSPTPLMGKL